MNPFKTAALSLAVAGTLAGAAAPALALPALHPAPATATVAHDADDGWNHGRDHWRDRRYRGDYGRRYYADNDYRRDYYRGPSWRGRDGRYYCKRSDGTTGLLIGGAAGALIGHGIAGDRTLGAILGGAGGALLGREIDRSGSRCR